MQINEYKPFAAMNYDEFRHLMLPNDIPPQLSSFEHVMSRHVNITNAELLNRLFINNINGSSRFIDNEGNSTLKTLYNTLKTSIYQSQFDMWYNTILTNAENTNRLQLRLRTDDTFGLTIGNKHQEKTSSFIINKANRAKCIIDFKFNNIYIVSAFPYNLESIILPNAEQHQLDLELNQALNQTNEYRNAIASENIPRILYLQAKASGSEFNTTYSNNNNVAKCEFITHGFFKVIVSQELGNPRTLNISYAIANEFFKTPTHYVDNLHWTTGYSAPAFKTYLRAHMYQTLPHKGITTPEIDNRNRAVNFALTDLSNHISTCKNIILQQENYIIEEMMNYIPHMHTIGKQPLEYYNQIERNIDSQFEI